MGSVRRFSASRGDLSILLSALIVLAGLARADARVSERIFTVEARNSSGVGKFEVTSDEAEIDPNDLTLTWALASPVDIRDPATGEYIATLLDAQLSVHMRRDCSIEMGLVVYSGGSPTSFHVASPLVSFPTIPAGQAKARAFASFGLSDLSGDGAMLLGEGTPGTGAFRGYYNGLLDGGTRFTHLVALIYVGNGGEATASQTDPSCGYRPIGEEVYDFSTEIAFTMTASDLASTTTSMDVPEPGVCVGDVDGNGRIDLEDLVEFLLAYGTALGEPGYDPRADFNRDGVVDVADLAGLLAAYGKPCPQGSAEPGGRPEAHPGPPPETTDLRPGARPRADS